MKTDVVVIGGGPAGMMAAVVAAEKGNSVVLLEKMRTVGRKLSITGKGRCNLTNATDIAEFISQIPGNGKFLYHAFHAFTNEDLMAWIHSLGVETKVERGNRVFPVSDDAHEVVEALKKAMAQAKVKIMVNTSVEEILVEKGAISGVKTANQEIISCQKVILATGGKSYPMTGSDGSGYALAKQLGHTIIPPRGSLVPLETYEHYDLQGLSLRNVAIQVLDEQKVVYDDFGEMLFTHFGISGPVVLSASSHILRISNVEEKLKQKKIHFVIDCKPALTEEMLHARIQRDFEKYTKKQWKNALVDLLPAKMIPVVVALSNIPPEKQVNQITKEERTRLVQLLKQFTVTVRTFRPVEEAIVTAGGVSVKEVQANTMESKLVSGLYFAGEILDVDAYTGGFNLQIAFSTGYVAGQLE